MKNYIAAGTILVLICVNVMAVPNSGCGPGGCYNVNQNGQGTGCGPTGCGHFGGSSYQIPAVPPSGSRKGAACGPYGCGPVQNNGYGVGCGPGGCGPVSPY